MKEPVIAGGATIWARQTLESEVFYKKPHVWFKIWFYLINRVNHAPLKGLDRGECFIRYDWICDTTGATKSEIDHCLRWMKSAMMLATRKATHGLVVKVNKYEYFQTLDNYYGDVKSDSIGETKAKQKRNKSDNIHKNYKNYKNEKNTEPDSEATIVAHTPKNDPCEFFEKLENQEKVIQMLLAKGMNEQIAREEINKFISYWTETNRSGTRQRWQMEKVFEVRRRLVTWFGKIKMQNKNFNQTRTFVI